MIKCQCGIKTMSTYAVAIDARLIQRDNVSQAGGTYTTKPPNIFTHLIPAIISMLCGMMLFPFFHSYYPTSTSADKLVFAFFLLAAAICLGMSATYHTLMNHSSSVSELWLRMDYVGIVILTLGDFVSGIYLIFYCEPALQRVYWTMVSDYTDLSSLCSFRVRVTRSVDYHALSRDSHDIGEP